MDFFQLLPDEIIIRILKNLKTVADLLSFQLVCRRFYVIGSDNCLWLPYLNFRMGRIEENAVDGNYSVQIQPRNLTLYYKKVLMCMEKLRIKSNRLEFDLESSSSLIELLQLEVKKLTLEKRLSDEKIDELVDKNNATFQSYLQVEKQKGNLQTSLGNLHSKSEHQSNEILHLKDTIKKLEAKISDQELECGTMQRQKCRIERKNSFLIEELAENEKQINSLKNELRQLRQRVSTKDQQFSEMEANHKTSLLDLERKIALERKEKQELKDKIRTIRQECSIECEKQKREIS